GVQPSERLPVTGREREFVHRPAPSDALLDGVGQARDAVTCERRNKHWSRRFGLQAGETELALALRAVEQVRLVPYFNDALAIIGIDAEITQDRLHVGGLRLCIL